MPRTALACVGVFARTNQRALEWARARSAQLVTEVNAATREAIREIIGLAFEEGLPPREAARLLRDVIGLHSRDAAAVADTTGGPPPPVWIQCLEMCCLLDT